jgi:hypothetical protein
MSISRLTFEDIPEISALLAAVYPMPENFSKIGCPTFAKDYLCWIYGGPNKEKHVLIGARIDNTLVAYQIFLYRKISYCGDILNGYLCTHAAISPQFDARIRYNYAIQFGKQHVLFNKDSDCFIPDCDLVYAFYDMERPTREVLNRGLRKYFQIDMKSHPGFNSFMVIPRRVKMYVSDNPAQKSSFLVRTATEEDASQLTELFNQVPDEPHFMVLMTEDELRHHFFGHPDHRTVVIERQGTIEAFINYYPLEIIKEDTISSSVIVEYLVSNSVNRTYAAALLYDAVMFAEEIQARGVVIENATYLDYDVYRPLGLMPTFRKMTMAAIVRKNAFTHVEKLRCDIK